MAPSEAFRTYREFHDAVEDELPALLPRDLRDYAAKRMGGVLKIAYERPRQHYELWFRGGGLEVAFHLEGRPEDDEPARAMLERRLAGLRRSLGGQIELEPFGPDWWRLFEHWPRVSRTHDVASEAAARLSEFVRLLEPMRRRANG